MAIRAAIDIGTNSVRLLICEVKAGKLERVLESDLITTRIGEGMATSRALKQGSMERTALAIESFGKKLERFAPDSLRAVATSAVRDSENGRAFCDLVKKKTGIEIEIISGKEEAYLSYLGVINGFADPLENAVVVDVGGGSTEIIWVNSKQQVVCESLPIGAVRLSEGTYSDADLVSCLEGVVDNIPRNSCNIIGVGGTITSMAAIDLKLEYYDSQRVHGHRLSLQKINEIYRNLEGLSLDERKQVQGLQAQRADIIIYGIKIFKLLLKSLKVENITVSEADILHGIIFSTGKKY